MNLTIKKLGKNRPNIFKLNQLGSSSGIQYKLDKQRESEYTKKRKYIDLPSHLKL